MKKHKQPAGLEPGIYFNLDDKIYHKDPALSHGGMVKVLQSWRDYWEVSPYNPGRDIKPTDAMLYGTRCHELLLDRTAFFKKYHIQGGGWQKDKISINRGDFDKINNAIEEIRLVPDAFAYFKLGQPEVTIVWRDPETGIMLRIRIDYLRTFGGIDYKRAKNIENNPIGWVLTDHGYDIQQELYEQGIRQAKQLLRAGKIKAHGVHDPAWLKKFMDEPDTLFRFLFQRSVAPYVFRFIKFDTEILTNARTFIDDAKARYKVGIETHGIARPPAGSAVTDEFSIYNLPRRNFDRGAIPL